MATKRGRSARSGSGVLGERKQSIIRVATEMFAERGFRDTSLASIADAAGLTQPGLLHHFPSKEDLLLAVLSERERGDRQRVRRTLAAHPRDLARAMHELVAHNEEARTETSLHTTLSAEATSTDHPAHRYFVDRYTRVRAALTDSMLDQAGPGADRQMLVDLVPVVLAVMDGLQLQWMLDPDLDMAASFDAFERLLDTVLPSDRAAT